MSGVGTTHHVQIGSDYHLIRPGSYRKLPAPLFGPRFTTGDPDYNLLNLWQHWVQFCWVGGFGATEWQDDAMYDEVVGVDTSSHEYMMLSRDLAFSNALGGTSEVRQFIRWNGKLYVLSYGTDTQASRLWGWDPAEDTWTLVKTFTVDCRDVVVFDDKLVIAANGDGLQYMNSNENFFIFDSPADIGSGVTPDAMCVYRESLYCAFNRKVWRLKVNDAGDWEWDGGTVFYEAQGVDYIDSMEVHLGFLYMASRDGTVFRTDGNNTFELWSFDNGSDIIDIRSFDGRFFISVAEDQLANSEREGVLYQLNGSALTELKRWGKNERDIHTGRLRVFGNRLYFGAASLLGMGDGFGVAVYDPREDSYHLYASQRDDVTYPKASTDATKWIVDDVYFYKGYIWASVRGYGVFRVSYKYRDVWRLFATFDTWGGISVPGPQALNGGWLTSSEFDGGTPGLRKLWDAITLQVDLPSDACGIVVEASRDGGDHWHDVGTLTKTDATKRRYTKTLRILDSDGTPFYGTRFKWRVTLSSTDLAVSPRVISVSVRFLPVPEPNWRWEFDVVLSDTQELLDGTVVQPDIEALRTALEDTFRAQAPVKFTDIDGTVWGDDTAGGALIYDLRERVDVITASADGAKERVVTVVLLEVKESYEVAE